MAKKFVTALGILLLAAGLSLGLGAASLTPVIFRFVRLPRTLACLLSGAAHLSVSVAIGDEGVIG